LACPLHDRSPYSAREFPYACAIRWHFKSSEQCRFADPLPASKAYPRIDPPHQAAQRQDKNALCIIQAKNSPFPHRYRGYNGSARVEQQELDVAAVGAIPYGHEDVLRGKKEEGDERRNGF
jgi:hypothetical protein